METAYRNQLKNNGQLEKTDDRNSIVTAFRSSSAKQDENEREDSSVSSILERLQVRTPTRTIAYNATAIA